MQPGNHPLVSCICVTHNSIDVLKRSIQCFLHQSYESKELILAFTSDNESTTNFMKELKHPSIKTLVFPSDTPLTLGEKRNAAIEYANGFYFCVWDDDDWHGVSRIEFQVRSLTATTFRSSVLSNIILYDMQTREAYLSATRWAWEQTLLCQKSLFENPELRYKNLERGEDSALLVNLKKYNLLLTTSHPHLYIYVYHGKNTFHRVHWEVNVIYWAKKLSQAHAILIQKILDGMPNAEASSVLEDFLLST